MTATITLKKSDLIDRLQTRRDEIVAGWDESLAIIDEEIAERASAKSNTELLAEWHLAIAEGLTAGTITINGNGAIKGGPAKPGTKGAYGTPGKRSTHRGGRYYGRSGTDLAWFDNDALAEHRAWAEGQKAHDCKPLDTAIDLLNLSTDTEVQVDAANYQALLNGTGGSLF